MQQKNKNIDLFNKTVGAMVKDLRQKSAAKSINKFANEYDFDRGNFSRFERGEISCRLVTMWKICEASNIKFSDFAKKLELKLGKNFKMIDE